MAVDFNQLADALMEQAQQLRHCAQLELDSVRHELISAQEAQRQAGVEIAALRHQVGEERAQREALQAELDRIHTLIAEQLDVAEAEQARLALEAQEQENAQRERERQLELEVATLRARLEGETGLRVRLQHRLSRARKAIVDLLIPLDSDAETDANPVPFSSADDDLSAELARRLMATAPAGPDH